MPRTPPKAIKRNPEKTRSRLLKAAIRLFSARGYHGVSVDEVVAAARVNKRMVYHYFGNKDELYLAALSEVFSRLEHLEFDAVQGGGDPRNRLSRLLEAYFEFLEDNPEFVRLLLWENLAAGRNIASHPERFSKNPFLDLFRQIVEDGVEQGVFRAPHDIRHLLVNFIGLCFIYFSNRYSLEASVGLNLDSAGNRKTQLAQVMDLVFEGLLTRSA